MSTILPQGRVDKISFFTSHEQVWADRAEAIGTTEARVAELSEKIAAARAARLAQGMAQQKAMAATLAFHEAVQAMAEVGGQIIQEVKAKAAIDGEEIYTLAWLPVPASPSRMGPPGKPTNFQVQLNQIGTLELTWKCANPRGSSGTVYQISRSVAFTGSAGAGGSAGGEGAGEGRGGQGGEMTFIGITGKKSFLDSSIPAGAAGITYQVVAVRSTAVGEKARFTVNLGVQAGTSPITIQPRRAA